MHLDSERRYEVPVDTSAVWNALESVDEYRRWWPWLDAFDAVRLGVDEIWACTVRSPLRFSLRFRIRLVDVIAGERIDAKLSGDLDGPASVVISPLEDGSRIVLRSSLTPVATPLSALTGIAPPLARWAHDRVLDNAGAQFARAVTQR